MSTIKVDTIATRTGSGNITVSNTTAGTSATLSGTLGVTGAITGTTQILNKASSGTVLDLKLSDTSIGGLGVISDRVYLEAEGSHSVYLDASENNFNPGSATGTDNDGNIDLGASFARWKDLYISGGLYVGGTGAANKLDDFEEGSWTPTVNNATGYAAQFGRYVKVGKMVFINGNINTSTTSANGGVIGGLPFASSNTGNSAGNLSIGYYSNIAQHVVWIGGYVVNNSTTMYIVGNSAGYTGTTLQRNGFNWASGNSRVMFSGVYETDA